MHGPSWPDIQQSNAISAAGARQDLLFAKKSWRAYGLLKERGAPPGTVGRMVAGSQNTASNDTFAACLKQVRIRIHVKQCWLAGEIGCTDAAISHWENGSRLPRQDTMRRIFQALEKGGALPTELVPLLVAWRNPQDKTHRRRPAA